MDRKNGVIMVIRAGEHRIKGTLSKVSFDIIDLAFHICAQRFIIKPRKFSEIMDMLF